MQGKSGQCGNYGNEKREKGRGKRKRAEIFLSIVFSSAVNAVGFLMVDYLSFHFKPVMIRPQDRIRQHERIVPLALRARMKARLAFPFRTRSGTVLPPRSTDDYYDFRFPSDCGYIGGRGLSFWFFLVLHNRQNAAIDLGDLASHPLRGPFISSAIASRKLVQQTNADFVGQAPSRLRAHALLALQLRCKHGMPPDSPARHPWVWRTAFLRYVSPFLQKPLSTERSAPFVRRPRKPLRTRKKGIPRPVGIGPADIADRHHLRLPRSKAEHLQPARVFAVSKGGQCCDMMFSFVRTPYRRIHHCQYENIVYDNFISEPL